MFITIHFYHNLFSSETRDIYIDKQVHWISGPYPVPVDPDPRVFNGSPKSEGESLDEGKESRRRETIKVHPSMEHNPPTQV